MRSIWKGSIAFGLVNVPVKVYSATQDHDIKFHQVHAKDNGRIRYKRVCEVCGEVVEATSAAMRGALSGACSTSRGCGRFGISCSSPPTSRPAISNRPPLILADEPTGELDSGTGLQIMSLFRRIASVEDGVAVVIATHDPTIIQIAHVTYEISDGVMNRLEPVAPLAGGVPERLVGGVQQTVGGHLTRGGAS